MTSPDIRVFSFEFTPDFENEVRRFIQKNVLRRLILSLVMSGI
jgi:hypothetical protein